MPAHSRRRSDRRAAGPADARNPDRPASQHRFPPAARRASVDDSIDPMEKAIFTANDLFGRPKHLGSVQKAFKNFLRPAKHGNGGNSNCNAVLSYFFSTFKSKNNIE